MSTDQKPASTDLTPVPTPPLAPSAKSTDNASKPAGSNAKLKKVRKLTKEQIVEEANKMVAAAEANAFPDKMISAVAWANKMNLSLGMVDKAYIRSKLALEGYDLDDDVNVKATDKRPYVGARGMILLPKSLIAAFNATMPADKQFTIGQPVDPTFEDGKLVLTPGI